MKPNVLTQIDETLHQTFNKKLPPPQQNLQMQNTFIDSKTIKMFSEETLAVSVSN